MSKLHDRLEQLERRMNTEAVCVFFAEGGRYRLKTHGRRDFAFRLYLRVLDGERNADTDAIRRMVGHNDKGHLLELIQVYLIGNEDRGSVRDTYIESPLDASE